MRLERADGEPAPVCGRVDPVAGESAREQVRPRVAANAVRDEPVRAVRHRDDEPRATPGALTFEECGEHLGDRREGARPEVGGLEGRQGRRRFGERARPAEVVQVVAGSERVAPLDPEARERAVDDALGHVVRPDAEPRGDAGPETLEHDVGSRAERAAELGLRLEVADDRLLARVECRVPLRCDRAQRIAVGRLSWTTRAPSRSSSRLAKGPGRCRVRSTTRSPASGCTGANLHYGSSALTESSLTIDKRRLLLQAAVRVFARRGFHAARVGDIAEEAGVAHGLLYHYFSSKEEVLETIFRETWADLLAAVRDVEDSGEPAREQLRQVAAILLRSWRRDPDLVRVLVRGVTRSAELDRRVGDVGDAFAAIERIVRRGQGAGDLRPELDARLASVVFYGAIEEILTGWVLELLPDGDEDVARAELTVVEILGGGLTTGGL